MAQSEFEGLRRDFTQDVTIMPEAPEYIRTHHMFNTRLPIPFHDFMSADEFEWMYRELLKAEEPRARVRKYGESGFGQKGIDLIWAREDRTKKVWQCKRYVDFDLSDFKKATEKFLDDSWDHWKDKNITEFDLVISCPLLHPKAIDHEDVEIERFEKKKIKFTLIEGPDIEQRLKNHRAIVQKYFSHVSGLEEHLCGTDYSQTRFYQNQRKAEIASVDLENIKEVVSKDLKAKLNHWREQSKLGNHQAGIEGIQSLRENLKFWDQLASKDQVECLKLLLVLILNQDQEDAVDQAKTIFAEIRLIDPAADVRISEAVILRHEDHHKEALAVLQGGEPTAAVQLQIGRCLLSLGQYPEALEALQNITDPALTSEQKHLMALTHLFLKDVPAALAAARKGAADRKNRHARFTLAVTLFYSCVPQKFIPDQLVIPLPIPFDVVFRDADSQQRLEQAIDEIKKLSKNRYLSQGEQASMQVWLACTLAASRLPKHLKALKKLTAESLDRLNGSPDDAALHPELFFFSISRNLPLSFTPAALEVLMQNTPNGPLVISQHWIESGRYQEAREHLKTLEPLLQDAEHRSIWLHHLALYAARSGDTLWFEQTIEQSGGWSSHPELHLMYLGIKARTREESEGLLAALEKHRNEKPDEVPLHLLFRLRVELADHSWVMQQGKEVLEQEPSMWVLTSILKAMLAAEDFKGIKDLVEEHQNALWWEDSGMVRRIRLEAFYRLGIINRAIYEAVELLQVEPTYQNHVNLAVLYSQCLDHARLAHVAQEILDRFKKPSEFQVLDLVHLAGELKFQQRKMARLLIKRAFHGVQTDSELKATVIMALSLGMDPPPAFHQRIQDLIAAGHLGSQVTPVQLPPITGSKVNTVAMEWEQYLRRERTLYELADQGRLKMVQELLLKTHSIKRPMLVVNAGRLSVEALMEEDEEEPGHQRDPQDALLDCEVLKVDLPTLLLLHQLGLLKQTTEVFGVLAERTHVRLIPHQRKPELAENPQVADFEEEIRELLEAGQLTLLPEPIAEQASSTAGGMLHGVNALLKDPTPKSRVVLSDRAAQQGSRDHFGQPVLDVLHVLESLVYKNQISKERLFELLQRLRRQGFMFIPLSTEELQFHLKNTQLEGGLVRETEDLKTLRAYYGQVFQGHSPLIPITIKADQSSDHGDITFAQHFLNTTRETFLWVYNTMPDLLMAEAHVNWVYRMLHIPMSVLLQQTWARHPLGRNSLNLETLDVELLFTLSSQIHGPKRRESFLHWYKTEVLRPRLAYKPELVDSLAQSHARYLQQSLREKQSKAEVNATRLHFVLVQELFPEQVKKVLLRDPTYLKNIGPLMHPVVTVGNIRFDSSLLLPQLVKAASGRPGQLKSLEHMQHKAHRYTVTAMFNQDQVGQPDQEYIFVLHPASKERSLLRLGFPQYLLVQPDVRWQKEYLESHPALREIPAQEREALIHEIIQEKSPFKRVERLERFVETSGVLHYESLHDAMDDAHIKTFREVKWLPEQPTSILRAVSLPGLLDDKGFQEAQLQAWETLKTQRTPDHLQLAAFAEVPAPLPEKLIEDVTALSEQEYDAVLKHLLRLQGSPVGMGQLLQLLQRTACKTRFSQRIRTKVVRRLSTQEMVTEFRAFGQILYWVYQELITPAFRWPASAVLTASWIHAGLMYSIMRTRLSAEIILQRFHAPHHALPLEMLAVRPELAGDRLFPEQDAELLYLHVVRQSLMPSEGAELGQQPWVQELLLNPQDETPPRRLHWRLMHRGFVRPSLLETHLLYSPIELGEFFLANHTPFRNMWDEPQPSEDGSREQGPEQEAPSSSDGPEDLRVPLSWWLYHARWLSNSPLAPWQDFLQEQIQNTQFHAVADNKLELALKCMFLCSETLPFLTDKPEARQVVLDALETYLRRAEQLDVVLPWRWISFVCMNLAMVGQEPIVNLKKLTELLESLFLTRPNFHLDVLSFLVRLGDLFGSDAPPILWDAILKFRHALSGFELLGDEPDFVEEN